MKLTTLILMSLAFAAGTRAGEMVKTPAAFAVKVRGHGKPVLLIPGLSSSGAVWDGTVAHLSEHYECHVFTLAGFAGQPRIGEPFLETVRNAMADYIRQMKLDRPIIIGHSLGGFLALWLAAKNPELPGPLVILDAVPFLPAVFNPTATAESTKPMAEQMRTGMAAGGEAFLKQSAAAVKKMVAGKENFDLVMSWAETTDPVAAADGMYDMFTTDLRLDVAAITAPVLVLGTWVAYRDNDADTETRGQVEKNFISQYARLNGVKIALADHAKHFIMLDDASWFYRQLDAFLAPER